jgi:hypothetical protein
LIKHLSDKQETRLKVGSEFFTFRYFSNEYVPKNGKPDFARQLQSRDWRERGFSGEYVVKVGDICYAAIGQIVNRALSPIRYQPSAGLVVNSPIETPELIRKVEAEWGNTTPGDLKESLVSDLALSDHYYPGLAALKRLRYYFPDEYHSLKKGKLRKKISEYEKAESKDKN